MAWRTTIEGHISPKILAAMHTALVRWAQEDGRAELPELIATALAATLGDDIADAGTGG